MNNERSYFDRADSATTFDPELQSDADIEAIIRADRERQSPEPERKPK